MSDRLKALREQRGVIVTELLGITDKASAEKRGLSNEETAKHGELFDKAYGLRKQIEAEERDIELRREAAELEAARDKERRNPPVNPIDVVAHGRSLMEALGRYYAARGLDRLSEEDRKLLTSTRTTPATEAFRKLFAGEMSREEYQAKSREFRALQVAPDTAGGFLLAPQEFIPQLIMNMDNMVFIRGLATKYPVTNTNGLGAPTLDTDFADLDWTTELLTGNEDTTMAFGKRELKPHPLAKLIKISKLLMRTAAMPIESIVSQRIAYKIGVTQEKAYLTGTGNNQPLGVFTAGSTALGGITTARDFSTGNTTTSISADGLIEAKMQTKAQYWRTGQWVFHRDAVRQIAKLKDGDGQYLWRPGLTATEPDTILNRPLNVSEYAPNTFTTGLYVGIFGDFSHYWICDLLDLQVQRLVELYAATNQDGFIARYEGDGMPVLEEAFARVKLA